jgi:GNAT superfamily N-acetyltransferase
MDAAIPLPAPPLAGPGFVLRPFRAADFEAARELERDAAAARWLPPLPAADGPGVVAFYEKCRREGSLLHLAIADSETGCCVVPAARRLGIATGALRVLTDWAFSDLGLPRVQVFVATGNTAAVGLAERSGFLREGTLRAYWDGPAGREDVVVLARLPGDPRQA